MAALGVGAVSGALTLGTLGARRPPRALMFAARRAGLRRALGLALVRAFWPAVAVLFITGFFGIIVVVVLQHHACSSRRPTRCAGG